MLLLSVLALLPAAFGWDCVATLHDLDISVMMAKDSNCFPVDVAFTKSKDVCDQCATCTPFQLNNKTYYSLGSPKVCGVTIVHRKNTSCFAITTPVSPTVRHTHPTTHTHNTQHTLPQ